MQIIPKLRGGQRRRFKRRYQRERNALVKTRLLVILRLNEGDSSVAIERSGICVRSTVSHVAQRYRTLGELGLEDGRRYNGERTQSRFRMFLSTLILPLHKAVYTRLFASCAGPPCWTVEHASDVL